MIKGEWFAILIGIVLILSVSVSAMPNPAAVYCTQMGYESSTVTSDDSSQKDICHIADLGIDCDSWEFYKGTCGKDANACAKNGYDTVTENKGEDAYSPEYAVCVPKQDALTGLVTLTGPHVRNFVAYLITGNAVDDASENVSAITASSLVNLSQVVNSQSEKFTPPKDVPKAQTVGVSSINSSTQSVPSSFDWRSYSGYNLVTPVKNQGGCGSCWAFGATAVAEAALKISRWDSTFNPDLSEQEVVSCSGAGSCNGGYHTSAESWIKTNGLVDESCMPYTATDSSCSACSGSAQRVWKIDNQGNEYSPSTSTIKYDIYNAGPVAMNLCWNNGPYWDGNGIYRCSSDSWYDLTFNCNGGHVITVVGWNDAGGYWIAKNSWGSSWNGDGYLKIGYDECGIGDSVIGYVVWAQKFWPSHSIRWVSSVNVDRGTSSGSYPNTYYRDGSYFTAQESCIGSTCSGFDQALNINNVNNPQYLDVFAYIRAREDSANVIYYQDNVWDWPFLGYIPYSSSFQLIKYNLCNSAASCAAYIAGGTPQFRFDVNRASCTSCSAKHVDIDWLVVEGEMDTDGDGVTDSNDACISTYGTYCHGCPTPTCGPCKANPTCPSSGAPYCSTSLSSNTQCDSADRCSMASGDNNYNIGGIYYCKGYCDGSGTCDYANGCYWSSSCDPDPDGDGVCTPGRTAKPGRSCTGSDQCLNTPQDEYVDSNGCTQSELDYDMDGKCNSGKSSPSSCSSPFHCPQCTGTDICPSTPTGQLVDSGGCSWTQADTDQDGYCNSGITSNIWCSGSDSCPGTQSGTRTDNAGCNQTQVDGDKDSYCDPGKTSNEWCAGYDACTSISAHAPSCNGCPAPTYNACMSTIICPTNGVPYYSGFNSTTSMCNANIRCASGIGDNNYFNPGTWACQGFCDGAGNCDYAGNCQNIAMCNNDVDNDGINNTLDLCPSTVGGPVDSNGCNQTQVDTDKDGVCDSGRSSPTWCTGIDTCAGTVGSPVDANGCSRSQVDADADGICDSGKSSSLCTGSDQCAGTTGTPVDSNGCNQLQVDADLDSICDTGKSSSLCTGSDQCAGTTGIPVDSNGCNQTQVDADMDAICDSGKASTLCSGSDSCPSTLSGQTVDVSGCSAIQVDADIDGVCNVSVTSTLCTGSDNCPLVSGPLCNGGCPDSSAPVISITSPSNITYNSYDILIDIAVTDPCYGSSWYLDGIQNITLGNPYSSHVSFQKGNTTLRFSSADSEGNMKEADIMFRVAFPPGMDLVSPINKTYLDDSIHFEISTDETVKNISVDIDGSNTTLCTDCDNASSQVILSDGWHDATYMIIDKADDAYYSYSRFFVDGSPPKVHNYNYDYDEKIEGDATTVFAVNYTESYVDTVLFVLNSSEESVACTSGVDQVCSITKDLSSVSDGSELYYYFMVNDTSGRKDVLFTPADSPYNYSAFLVVVDRSPPVIEISSPVEGASVGHIITINVVLDEIGSIKYAIDGGTNSTLCASCKEGSAQIEGLLFGKHNLTVWAEDELGHNSNSSSHFTVDTDVNQDGTPDVIGNDSNVTTNLVNLSIEINGSSDFNSVTENVTDVIFKENGTIIVEFDYNFSTPLNFSNITVKKQNTTDKGSIIITGVDLGGRTKTVFVDHLSSTYTLCIKDNDVASISEVTSSCGAADEIYIGCPGTVGSYSCVMDGSRYRVSGLLHSAITELYVPPSSSGGGGSGGGGGGGSATRVQDILPTSDGVEVSFVKKANARLIYGEMYSFTMLNIGLLDTVFSIDDIYYTISNMQKVVNIDLDGDAVYDVAVELVEIKADKVTLIFSTYSKPIGIAVLPPDYSLRRRQVASQQEQPSQSSVNLVSAPQEPATKSSEPIAPIKETPMQTGSDNSLSLIIFVAIVVFAAVLLIIFIKRKPHTQERPIQEIKKASPIIIPTKDVPIKQTVKEDIKPVEIAPQKKIVQAVPEKPPVHAEDAHEKSIHELNDDINKIKDRLKKIGV